MKDFADKVAVVTGGASGIGLAVTEALVERGAKVVIADIEKKTLEDVVARFKTEQGAEVTGVVTDVTERSSIEALRDEALEKYGKVNILFNNAGVGGGGLMAEATPESWQWVLDVNLVGVVDGIRAFLPGMLASDEECHIINTASMAGMTSPPGMGSYNASKHAVVTITETLSAEIQGTNVGASVLCPGFVKTKIHEAGRNRQEDKYGAGAEPSEEAVGIFAAFVNNGIEPSLVARLVLRAVEDNRLHIFTHPTMKQAITDRYNQLMADYDENIAVLTEWGEQDADQTSWPTEETLAQLQEATQGGGDVFN